MRNIVSSDKLPNIEEATDDKDNYICHVLLTIKYICLCYSVNNKLMSAANSQYQKNSVILIVVSAVFPTRKMSYHMRCMFINVNNLLMVKTVPQDFCILSPMIYCNMTFCK